MGLWAGQKEIPIPDNYPDLISRAVGLWAGQKEIQIPDNYPELISRAVGLWDCGQLRKRYHFLIVLLT